MIKLKFNPVLFFPETISLRLEKLLRDPRNYLALDATVCNFLPKAASNDTYKALLVPKMKGEGEIQSS